MWQAGRLFLDHKGSENAALLPELCSGGATAELVFGPPTANEQEVPSEESAWQVDCCYPTCKYLSWKLYGGKV